MCILASGHVFGRTGSVCRQECLMVYGEGGNKEARARVAADKSSFVLWGRGPLLPRPHALAHKTTHLVCGIRNVDF